MPVGVGNNGSPHNHGLFRFDLSSIPSGATINSAKLRFIVTQAGPLNPPASFEIHRVLKNWGEGSKAGLPATTGEATWNSRLHQQSLWSAGGGLSGTDFATTASATATFNGTGSTNEFSSAGLIADVQNWLTNSAGNFGWLLLAQSELAASGRQVGSRESGTNQPVLEIHYSAFVMFNAAKIGSQFRFSFEAETNRTYAVEFRDSLNSSNWTTLTNIPSQQTATTIHVTNAISVTQRFYRLRTP
ncbi:MAG: DNRLRE domain-containing protein [Verrucomicrobia bacterium]|nr:MAG: DNRLRE domain-containing protein [Verrucomicrobiota bacterium]